MIAMLTENTPRTYRRGRMFRLFLKGQPDAK